MSRNTLSTSNIVTNFQVENFKRQIALLDQKLEIKQKDYEGKIAQLNDQISQLSSSEVKLRNQLSSKDKALYELNNIIKEYQNEVINLKKNLCSSEEELNSMSAEFNAIKSNCNNISRALNQRDESHSKLEQIYNETKNEQIKSERKLKDLVEVMKQYSSEMNDLTEKCTQYERDNFDLRNDNMTLTNELNKVAYENKNFVATIENLRNELAQYQNINNSLSEENNKIKFELDKLQNETYKQSETISLLRNQGENFTNIISTLKQEKNKLETNINTNVKINQKNIGKLAQSESELNSVINEANDNIKMITTWVENYMGVFFSKGVTIPELPLRSNNSRINFSILKQKLTTIREKINDDLVCVDNYKSKIDFEIKDIKEMCEFNLKKVKEIYDMIKFEVQRNNYFEIDYSKANCNLEEVIILEDMVNQLLQYSYREKLSKGNNKNVNVEQITNENRNLKEVNEKLLDKINSMQNEFDENSKEEMKLLEKRNKNLQTEIELKQMQIKSLEEMLSRRGSNVSNNDKENLLIKQLRNDKEKLIKDNMVLLNENSIMKKTLKDNSLSHNK